MAQRYEGRNKDGPNPYFSVVIATYNRSPLLTRAIDSVLEQSFEDFELIVVDDGSTDDTPAVVSAFGDPRLFYIRRDHRGVSATRNEGLHHARGRYVVFLDSDDEGERRWLEVIHHGIEPTEPDLVVCGMEADDPGGRRGWRWVPSREGIETADLVVHFESGQVAFDRTVLSESGGFATTLEFGENTELAIRLMFGRARPLSIVTVPEVLVRVRPAGRDRNYSAARVASAQYVLDRYPVLKRELPRLWASYQAIVGTGHMPRGETRSARRAFLRAALSDPRLQHFGRLGASMLRPVAESVWPLERRTDTDEASESEVVFVALASGLGGSMRSLGTLLSHLQGVTRTVACPGPSGFTELIDSKGCFERRLSLPTGDQGRLRARASAALTLALYARRHREHLAAFHANGLSERAVVAVAAAVARRPVVVWVHEWKASPWSRRLAPVLNWINPDTRFVAVSQQARDMLLASKMADPDEIRTVANPIDPLEVCASEERRPEPESCTIGFVGAPVAYKGFHLLPHLIRILEPDDVQWLIYSGPRSVMTETWSELRTLEGPRVRLMDKVVDVREAYAQFDVVVCPSLEESFGRVAAEAMANGIPVVASDIPALRKLVGDHHAGLLFRAGDALDASRALRRLIGDRALRDRLGRSGRSRSAAFDPVRIAREMARIYGVDPDQ